MNIINIDYKDTWPIRHKVMWPDKDLDYIKLNSDKLGEHFGLYEGAELISVISVFIEGKSAQFRKFATLSKYQNKGYGSQLLRYTINYLEGLDLKIIWC